MAHLVRNDLLQHSFDIFMDVGSLDSGPFEPVILAEIEKRPHFLVLLEPHSLDRVHEPGDWLRRELAHALTHCPNVVPLLANGARMPHAADLPSDVARLSSLNALAVPHDYFAEAMTKLRERFLRDLTAVGITAGAAQPARPMIIGDDHPMWSFHSGGDRHSAPDWNDGDERLAQTQDRLPPLTAVFHTTLVDHPGWLLSVKDLAVLTNNQLSSSRVIAGALSGYVSWCDRLNRRFPFYWWDGRNGESARYAMQPRIARLFSKSRHEA